MSTAEVATEHRHRAAADEKAEVSARAKGTDIDRDMARKRGEPAPWGAGFGLVSVYR